MAAAKEMVLYYNPNMSGNTALLKSVLVRMGIRIKNIPAVQVNETVGYLAGLDGFSPVNGGSGPETEEEPHRGPALIPEQVLVMKNFTGSRIDQLLANLRKAGVPKIELKAVVTETNSGWTFYELYQEIKKEHETFGQKDKE